MLRARIVVVIVCLSLTAAIVPHLPAAGAEPHENPVTAPIVYDPAAVFQKYAQAVDYVFMGDNGILDEIVAQASLANIPPELKSTAGTFLESCRSMALIFPDLQNAANNTTAMIAQARFEDARATAAAAKSNQTMGYSYLIRMENAAADMGNWWHIEKAGQVPEFYSLQEALLKLRSFLDSMDEVFRGAIQPLSIPATPTNLALEIQPPSAYVGDKLTLSGVLTAEGKPLVGRIVTLVVDNTTVASTLTGANGSFQKDITVPFRYLSEVPVQAVFSPVGSDVGRYSGSSSVITQVKRLFYSAFLSVGQEANANPGLEFPLTVVFDYGGDPSPDVRPLTVLLDGSPIFEGGVGRATLLRLALAPGVPVGSHNLTVVAAASGRYAPVNTTADLAVERAVPIIEIDTQPILLLPLTHKINGTVSSPLGPLQNTTVNVALGSWTSSAPLRDDGTFTATLKTGLGFTLLGTQDLKVSVHPVEPWYKSGSNSVPVFVVNPVNILGILIILAAPLRLFASGRKKSESAGKILYSPLENEGGKANNFGSIPNAGSNHGGTTLALYRGVLNIVQALTSMVFKPFQTLREFAAASAPALGGLGDMFLEFTAIIERMLYSRGGDYPDAHTRAQDLSRRFVKGNRR